jgi:hypothetical protein
MRTTAAPYRVGATCLHSGIATGIAGHPSILVSITRVAPRAPTDEELRAANAHNRFRVSTSPSDA